MAANPRHGEVWLVDMGMTAKTGPTVVLIDPEGYILGIGSGEGLHDAPRSLIIHLPITKQGRGSELEVPLGHRNCVGWPGMIPIVNGDKVG